jgi:hypothetical protein
MGIGWVGFDRQGEPSQSGAHGRRTPNRPHHDSGNAAATLRFLDCGALGRRFPTLTITRGGRLGASVLRWAEKAKAAPAGTALVRPRRGLISRV